LENKKKKKIFLSFFVCSGLTTTTTTTTTSTAAVTRKIGGNVSAVNSAGREAAAGPAVPAADDGAALVGLDHDRP
jgi:hypothetical protein